MLGQARLEVTEQPCRSLQGHRFETCTRASVCSLSATCPITMSWSKTLCEAIVKSLSWKNETVKHKTDICIYKTSGRNALRTLNNTCDHWYDIVITKERQHWMCFLPLPQWKFQYLASAWAFQQLLLWLSTMANMYVQSALNSKYSAKKSIKRYTV